jgi:NADH:ubiquinone oxidoreductase subunit 3 (subunit A)
VDVPKMNTLLMLFIFLPILIFILLLLNFLLASSNPDAEKLSLYECGFTTVYAQTRGSFHINFYVVAIFFLVFDLEIVLIFPLALSLSQVGLYGFTIAVIFFIILTVGFVMEISSGALKISTPIENEKSGD